MIPNLDWAHGIALALGALAAYFVPKLSTAGGAKSEHPLFDTLIQVLEGKLTDLIHVEPGPGGEPMFTLRVVLVPDDQKK